MQIRYMQAHQPPVRIIVPGRVYRRDDLDLTHTPMFTQIEGLVVGEGISLARSQGHAARRSRARCSAPTSRVRFRPSFFPYTEPSAEVDISCWQCDGAGCAMCKQTGWIEIGGCGMVHPAVFEAVGYDAERYTGFAFGIGIERVAILRYQRRGHPAVLRERPAVPGAVPDCEDSLVSVAARLRRRAGATAGETHRRASSRLRGFEVRRRSSRSATATPSSTSRSPRTGPTA